MWLISSNSLKIRYAKGKELLKLTLSISRQTYIIFNTVFSRLEAPCASASQDLITGTDRANSELSNGGFGLKIGQLLSELN